MASAGKALLVKVSPTTGGAGTYTAVADIRSASMSTSAGLVDISAFNDSQVSRIMGLKDATYSLSGFWKSTDTNGQVAIRAAWSGDSTLWVQFLPDGATGFKQEVKVSKFDISASVDGAVELSVEIEGTGAIASI